MKSRDLRHRITIQRPVSTQDTTTGNLTTSWQDVAEVWAQISPLSVKEFIAAQGAQSKVAARIKIKYRADIDASMRALHGAREYYIEGVLSDPDSLQEYLTLAVSEGPRG